MERIKEFLPYIGAISAIILYAFGYGKLNQRVTEMEKEHEDLKERLKQLEDKNSEQHGKIFDSVKDISITVARIDGHINGYLEAKKDTAG